MAGKQLVQIKVNGRLREATVEPRMLLVHFIRNFPGLTVSPLYFTTGSAFVLSLVWSRARMAAFLDAGIFFRNFHFLLM